MFIKKMAQNVRVWTRFTVKSKNAEVNLRIQDVPCDRLGDVIDIFWKYFVPEETCHKAAGVHKSEEAMAEGKEFVTGLIDDLKTTPHNILICCLDADPDVVEEVVGASLTTIARKEDPEEDLNFKLRTKEMSDMFGIMDKLFSKFDAMKALKLDSLYDDRGVVIHPNYRGLGLAKKFFNVRRKICHELGLPLTGAWMTSAGSQKAATRDGWDTAFEVPYEEFGREHGINFENVPESCKFMTATPLPAD